MISEAAAPGPGPDILEIGNLHAFYGDSHVLHGLALRIAEGELVTLLGRNGAGKTSTLRSIMGLMRRDGAIRFRGRDLSRATPEQIARSGIGYVPEERGIFASLTVEENLLLPPRVLPGGVEIEELYDLFPNLHERRTSMGTQLSGGEQQMLAIARILRTGAEFILLDEPTEGLAPVIVEQIGRTIQGLKARGLTVLLVEQNFAFAREIADRHYVLEEGHLVSCVTAADLRDAGRSARLEAELGI